MQSFDQWRQEKEVKESTKQRKGRIRTQLRRERRQEHPPEHIWYKGNLYKVLRYLGDLTWRCRLLGSDTIDITLHEVECDVKTPCQCQECGQRAHRPRVLKGRDALTYC